MAQFDNFKKKPRKRRLSLYKSRVSGGHYRFSPLFEYLPPGLPTDAFRHSMDVAQRIKRNIVYLLALRKKAKMFPNTQRGLCAFAKENRYAGIHQPFLTYLGKEPGHKSLQFVHLCFLCIVLEVDLYDLIFRDLEEENYQYPS